ncbi:hypothetical protein LGL08_10365 [Clostridium estertheticum]|uniref:hypothetical protein n=1 Tax=Clostridium estertheticum TaxID=238834 RepID=UPI001CF491A5|nr:hypothetical protein [Clostridium estertheticum]MCB2309129.1 hypothetical protein [Clostridium estertheticum]MCB2344879.1 hypothetical protein [Clostridium estertheticum]MCB2349955.1 hypothetical protein [Clostridium estertheticum]WAG48125.1 hypothetical protein LL127_22010 [Clostridium estertheticum]
MNRKLDTVSSSNSTTKDLDWNFLAFENGKEYAKHYISLDDNYSFSGGIIDDLY